MKNLLLLCLTLMLSGCCCQSGVDSLPEECPPLVKKIDSEEFAWLTQQLTVKWRKELMIDLKDASLYYGNSVHTLRFELTSMSICDVKQAREMLVDVVEGILDGVNRNPIMSAQLFSYPLTAENLEIYIDYLSFYNLYVDPLKVGFTSLENGVCKYWAADVKINSLYSWHSRIEPYFRSREIVQLGRAAEELYDEEHPRGMRPIKELYTP